MNGGSVLTTPKKSLIQKTNNHIHKKTLDIKRLLIVQSIKSLDIKRLSAILHKKISKNQMVFQLLLYGYWYKKFPGNKKGVF